MDDTMTAATTFERSTGRRTTSRGAALLWAAVLTAFVPGAAAAADVNLAPHRAVYELTLERSSAGSGVAELVGRMVYELKGSRCKGYGQVIRFVTRTENPKGEVSVTDLRSTFQESADAGTLNFETTQYQNERLSEQTQGEARRSGPAELRITLKRPKRQRLTFKGSYMFPMQHTVSMVAAAIEGQKIFVADLYDGAEKGQKAYETTAVIGERRRLGDTNGLVAVKNAAALADVAAWPVSLSFYAKNKPRSDAVPEYELSFLLYANGVSRKLFIDYGSFALRGVLSRLDMLPAEPCKPGE